MVKQEMARVNIDILGISELKWTRMDEFNSNDHYIYNCGQESLLWIKTRLGVVGCGSFHLLKISSIPHYCTVSTFHHLSQFVLKAKRLHYILVQNHMQKYGQEGFFTSMKPKHQSD